MKSHPRSLSGFAPFALGLALAASAAVLPQFVTAQEPCTVGSTGQCNAAPNGQCSRGGICLYPELQPQSPATPAPATPVRTTTQTNQPPRLPAVAPGTPTDRGSQEATDRGSQQAQSNTTLLNPLKADSLQELLVDVLQAVVQIGMIVLTLMIIWVGFLFVAARGNEEKIRDARRALFYTIIGGLILLGAQAIGLAIQSTIDSITR